MLGFSSQFSVLSSQFSVLSSQFSVLSKSFWLYHSSCIPSICFSGESELIHDTAPLDR
jgi:hypothetical protein